MILKKTNQATILNEKQLVKQELDYAREDEQ